MTETGERPGLWFLTAGRGYGGGECSARDVLDGLIRRNWKITLVGPMDAPLLAHPDLRRFCEIRPVNLSVTMRNPLKFLAVSAGLSFPRAIERNVLLYGNGFITLKWLALCGGLLHRAHATVCHLRESDYRHYGALRSRFLSRRITRFIAISETVRSEFLARAGIAPRRILKVFNGIQTDRPTEAEKDRKADIRSELGIPADAPLVTMVARTDSLKGHSVLLRAAIDLRKANPRAILLIVGLERGSPREARLYDAIVRQIETASLKDMVRWTGYRRDAREIMRCSDVVAVPSTSEGFGRTAIEAMAEGTPVVASDVGGLAEIVTDGTDGLLFRNGDGAHLARRLVEALQNADLRASLAGNGRRTAASRFSIEQTVEQVEKTLLDAWTEISTGCSPGFAEEPA